MKPILGRVEGHSLAFLKLYLQGKVYDSKSQLRKVADASNDARLKEVLADLRFLSVMNLLFLLIKTFSTIIK